MAFLMATKFQAVTLSNFAASPEKFFDIPCVRLFWVGNTQSHVAAAKKVIFVGGILQKDIQDKSLKNLENVNSSAALFRNRNFRCASHFFAGCLALVG